MKWIRKALKGISLTAAMFVFQACYGTMDDYYDHQVTFRVVDGQTGEPIQGVQVWMTDVRYSDSTDYETSRTLQEYTDENGKASLWVCSCLERFTFIDGDSMYTTFDTVFRPESTCTIDIRLKKAQ